MKKSLILILFALLSLNLIESKLRVFDPPALKEKFTGGEIHTNLATYGDIPYGVSMYGKILYDIDNTDAEMACKPITTINVLSAFSYGFDTYPIVMVDRGSCSFVTKTRNAQQIGAKALIIINNNDDDINNIYAIDDGTGEDISIPSMIISQKDGQILKDYLKKKPQFENLGVLLEFEIPKSDVINFEIIMSSTNKEIYLLIKDLEDALEHFNEGNLNFYPMYYMQSHPDWVPIWNKKDGEEEKEINSDDCFGNGHFCYFLDSEANELNVFKGQDILLEDLRQICIFKERKVINLAEYIDYMKAFYDQCLNTDNPSVTKECSQQAMRFIGYDEAKVKEIDDCVNNSFGNADPSVWYKTDNTILHREKRFLHRMHVIINPSVIVNRKLIYVSPTLFYLF